MFNYKTVNNIAFIVLLIIFALSIIYKISIYYYVSAVCIYLIILIVGSVNIKLNFYFKSISKVENQEKQISLTFDDGPSEIFTKQVLQILKKHNVKACFFVKGKNAEKFPAIIREIDNQNHIIANHTYSHINLQPIWPLKKYYSDIIKANEIISSIISKYPKFFRPPFGVTNPIIAKAIKKSKLISIAWNIRTFDLNRSPEKILRSIKTNIKSGDIILMHDTSINTVDALDKIISHLKEKGFIFARLDELLKINAYD